MRTTLDVDSKLLEDVVKTTGEKSKSKAVNRALEEYIRRTKIDELRAMAGKFPLEDTSADQKAADLRRQRLLDRIRTDTS